MQYPCKARDMSRGGKRTDKVRPNNWVMRTCDTAEAEGPTRGHAGTAAALTSSCLGSCLCLYLQGGDKVDLSGRGRWWLEALKVSGKMWSASSAGPQTCAGTLVMN